MEKRTLLAIAISIAILLIYQYFFLNLQHLRIPAPAL